MTEMNRREALKAGAAGLALVASPFAIAQGSVIQKDIRVANIPPRAIKNPKEKFSILDCFHDLPLPCTYSHFLGVRNDTEEYAFWLEGYDPSVKLHVKRTDKTPKEFDIHWDNAFCHSTIISIPEIDEITRNNRIHVKSRSKTGKYDPEVWRDPLIAFATGADGANPFRVFASITALTHQEAACRLEAIGDCPREMVWDLGIGKNWRLSAYG